MRHSSVDFASFLTLNLAHIHRLGIYSKISAMRAQRDGENDDNGFKVARERAQFSARKTSLLIVEHYKRRYWSWRKKKKSDLWVRVANLFCFSRLPTLLSILFACSAFFIQFVLHCFSERFTADQKNGKENWCEQKKGRRASFRTVVVDVVSLSHDFFATISISPDKKWEMGPRLSLAEWKYSTTEGMKNSAQCCLNWRKKEEFKLCLYSFVQGHYS